jgi:hypothetical protein
MPPLTEEEKFERRIEKELASISDKDIRTFETINTDIKMVVNKLFSQFPEKDYPKNTKEKRINIIDELAERKYEWVSDISDLNKRDGVYAVDGRDFWNIELKYLGKFYKYCGKRNILFMDKTYEKHLKPHDRLLLFRKVSKKDKFRILLFETLTEI